MTNYSVGHQAEQDASKYLETLGYKIVALNWKNKYCEIDIVARKDKTIHFIEVKYRKNNKFGDGFDYITPKKLKQMKFAANFWVSENSFTGDVCLAVVSASPEGFEFIRIVD